MFWFVILSRTWAWRPTIGWVTIPQWKLSVTCPYTRLQWENCMRLRFNTLEGWNIIIIMHSNQIFQVFSLTGWYQNVYNSSVLLFIIFRIFRLITRGILLSLLILFSPNWDIPAYFIYTWYSLDNKRCHYIECGSEVHLSSQPCSLFVYSCSAPVFALTLRP